MKSTNFFYTISKDSKRTHHIQFEAKVKVVNKKSMTLSLPVWRPGRYEIANYAQYLKDFKVVNEQGKTCKYHKNHHSDWTIRTLGCKEIIISYSFYSDRIDAGFSYTDEHQIYLNPVNCFFYAKNHPCQYELKFRVNRQYRIYSSLQSKSKFVLKAKSYDELFDSPIIASDNAKVSVFKVGNYSIRNVFQGFVHPDFKKLKNDFTKFIALQIKCFGRLPVNEFTFLNQIVTHKLFHGVEHKKNTVLAYGPSYLLHQENGYQRFLGLACHEFYHIWNVKHIRPIEMSPYDFSKENIHSVGYIIEGVTTYQGDVKLWQSKVINDDAYFNLLSEELNKHLNNSGRYNQSVRESSVDLWLDGYSLGIPGKKVSIYTEGCLISLIIDILLLEKTNGKYGLDEVMREMYEAHSSNKGYQEQHFIDTIKSLGGNFIGSLYNRLINDSQSYEKDLKKALGVVGLILKKESINIMETNFGIKTDGKGHPKVVSMMSGSPAEKAGIAVGYNIHSINDINLEGNLNEWLEYFNNQVFELGVSFKGDYKKVKVRLYDEMFYSKCRVVKKNHVSAKEMRLFKRWRKY